MSLFSITKFVSNLLTLLVVLGLIFRGTFYWMIPVPAGEPMGGGEVIELLFYFSILGIALIQFLLSLALLLKQQTYPAITFCLLAIAMPALYYLLHPFIPGFI